jgi:N-methylhydantoinase A
VSVDWECAIAVDVGGTFTDLVLTTTDGRNVSTKVPSVPDDPSAGVFDAVAAASAELDVPTTELLTRCERFVHGSTVATNAVLTRDLASVGLITSTGFRDTLEIRRGIREDQWDHRAPWPPVLVPRFLRMPVSGRISVDGEELEPLRTEDVDAAVEAFREHGVDAVAICLLHSYANADHERTVADIVRREWSGPLTTVSSELVPHLGEYARSSTSVVNAGLVPRVGNYLARLAEGLGELGLARPLLLLQSNGGTVPVSAVAARPVDLVLSGPAAVGSATRTIAPPDGPADAPLVTMEIGGTSCDVAVAVGGTVPVVDGVTVGGYHLDVPAVDVHTVGAGGGTIARVDRGGLLRVGPEGAGAVPGPACYGRGGMLPTATDAHLRLGRLRAGPYAGGSIVLDAELARRAIDEHVADPLGLGPDEAAIGIITLLEQHLCHAVETITVQRGRDPRRMILVAAGGAGGLHASLVGRALGCSSVIVPAEAGVFCAHGMLDSELRRDVSRSVSGTLDDLGGAGVIAELRAEQARAHDHVTAEWPPTDVRWAWYADLRYPGQQWSVRVDADDTATTTSLRASFEAEYRRLYGHIQPDGALEITGVGVIALGALPRVPRPVVDGGISPTPVEHRRCWVDRTTGWFDTPVHDADDLGAGARIDGPYIIEARTTTVLGAAGDRLSVLPNGDFHVELT